MKFFFCMKSLKLNYHALEACIEVLLLSAWSLGSLFTLKIYIWVCMTFIWVYEYHVYTGSCGCWRSTSDSLELQVVVCYLMWVLKPKLSTPLHGCWDQSRKLWRVLTLFTVELLSSPSPVFTLSLRSLSRILCLPFSLYGSVGASEQRERT